MSIPRNGDELLYNVWSRTTSLCVRLWLTISVLALALLCGCAKPIKTEYYSRTPVDVPSADMVSVCDGDVQTLRVGVGAESMATGQAFVSYAASTGVFDFVGWAMPDNVESLAYQLECTVSFEHDGDSQVHYCLGRLIANVYNADHSKLLERAAKFHEAMYTPSRGDRRYTHEGVNVHGTLQDKLFDELITHVVSACNGTDKR